MKEPLNETETDRLEGIMNRYNDIIDLPHYEPRHKRMTMENRAAQFAPFAALTGHGAAINETTRLTESMSELSVDEQLRLSRILNYAYERQIEVKITYFLPDQKKEGGKYEDIKGKIRKVDDIERVILLSDGSLIPLDFIYDIKQ